MSRRIDFLPPMRFISFILSLRLREVTYDENIDPTLSVIQCRSECGQTGDGRNMTYCASIGHNFSDVIRCVHCVCIVRALIGKFCIIGHNEREALTVDDMPVESVELIDRTRQAHALPP